MNSHKDYNLKINHSIYPVIKYSTHTDIFGNQINNYDKNYSTSIVNVITNLKFNEFDVCEIIFDDLTNINLSLLQNFLNDFIKNYVKFLNVDLYKIEKIYANNEKYIKNIIEALIQNYASNPNQKKYQYTIYEYLSGIINVIQVINVKELNFKNEIINFIEIFICEYKIENISYYGFVCPDKLKFFNLSDSFFGMRRILNRSLREFVLEFEKNYQERSSLLELAESDGFYESKSVKKWLQDPFQNREIFSWIYSENFYYLPNNNNFSEMIYEILKNKFNTIFIDDICEPNMQIISNYDKKN